MQELMRSSWFETNADCRLCLALAIGDRNSAFQSTRKKEKPFIRDLRSGMVVVDTYWVSKQLIGSTKEHFVHELLIQSTLAPYQQPTKLWQRSGLCEWCCYYG